MKVMKATGADLDAILDWLEREYTEDGEGFWCNREVIADACGSGTLWVIRSESYPVAFQVGDISPDIVCVRKDKRGLGYGGALVEALLTRAQEAGVSVLHGECAPATSLSYWQRHGFKQYEYSTSRGRVLVRKVLHRDLPQPPELSRASGAN